MTRAAPSELGTTPKGLLSNSGRHKTLLFNLSDSLFFYDANIFPLLYFFLPLSRNLWELLLCPSTLGLFVMMETVLSGGLPCEPVHALPGHYQLQYQGSCPWPRSTRHEPPGPALRGQLPSGTLLVGESVGLKPLCFPAVRLRVRHCSEPQFPHL